MVAPKSAPIAPTTTAKTAAATAISTLRTRTFWPTGADDGAVTGSGNADWITEIG